jgi:hypothetical protein
MDDSPDAPLLFLLIAIIGGLLVRFLGLGS